MGPDQDFSSRLQLLWDLKQSTGSQGSGLGSGTEGRARAMVSLGAGQGGWTASLVK